MTTQISGDTGVSQIQFGVTGRGPVLVAEQTATQNVTSNIETKVNLSSVIEDSISCFDTSLSRYTPNISGWYNVSGMVRCNGTSMMAAFAYIYKNGSKIIYAGSNASFAGSSHPIAQTLVYMNGTTDYLELWGMVAASSGAKFEYVATGKGTLCVHLVRSV